MPTLTDKIIELQNRVKVLEDRMNFRKKKSKDKSEVCGCGRQADYFYNGKYYCDECIDSNLE